MNEKLNNGIEIQCIGIETFMLQPKDAESSVREAISLTPGKVITIPANIKHWHGAKKDSWFSHIAVEVPGDNAKTEWCEKVVDEEYNKL